MLIPRRGFTTLRGPFTSLCRCRIIIGQKHTARRTCYYLVAVKTDCIIFTECTRHIPVICCAERFCGILNQNGIVLFANSRDFRQFCRRTVKIGNYNQPDIRIKVKGSFKGFRIHIPSCSFTVYKYGNPALINDRIHGRGERHIRTKNFFSGFKSRQFQAKMYGSRAAGKRNGIFTSEHLGDRFFQNIQVFTDSRHPVRFERFRHIS